MSFRVVAPQSINDILKKLEYYRIEFDNEDDIGGKNEEKHSNICNCTSL